MKYKYTLNPKKILWEMFLKRKAEYILKEVYIFDCVEFCQHVGWNMHKYETFKSEFIISDR